LSGTALQLARIAAILLSGRYEIALGLGLPQVFLNHRTVHRLRVRECRAEQSTMSSSVLCI
jgi:hypothetical protein